MICRLALRVNINGGIKKTQCELAQKERDSAIGDGGYLV